MTVKELKEKLNEYPDNMDVYLYSTSEFGIGLANSIYVDNAKFSESPNNKPLCSEKVLVIEDI